MRFKACAGLDEGQKGVNEKEGRTVAIQMSQVVIKIAASSIYNWLERWRWWIAEDNVRSSPEIYAGGSCRAAPSLLTVLRSVYQRSNTYYSILFMSWFNVVCSYPARVAIGFL